MSRMLKGLLILCVAAASTAAAAPKKNADVEKAVKAELLKKSFATKILVGSSIPCPQNINTSGRSDAIKAIDTELSPDGSVRYYARANCFYPTTPGVIELGVLFDSSRYYVDGPLSGEIPIGASVWVRSVDFREDRVEVNLYEAVTGGHSGKIKYMLGADYRTWSADELMEAIARGIVIPAYERLVRIKTEFEELRAKLQEAESRYNAATDAPAAKLANAIALREILENLQKNRADFAATGKSDPQAGGYSEKLTALRPEIARLSEAAHKERVARVRDQLKAQLAELSEIQTKARQKPPSSLAEWQERSEVLTRYSTLLDDRQKLLNGLKNENERPTAEDYKYLDEGRVEFETDRKALSLGHQQLELADLTTQYRQLTKKRAQMLDGYMRAFATNKETPALHDLISVLSQIVTNRDRAVGLGDKTAVAQLAQCRAEAEKYRKKLRPNDPFIAAGGQGASVAKMEDEVPKKVTISASLAVGMLLQKTTPVYPPVAKAAHVSGTVVLKATISKTGSVEDLNVVEGPPLLQGAAIEAVKSWRYRPYLQKNEPVEVETTVNVIFVLGG